VSEHIKRVLNLKGKEHKLDIQTVSNPTGVVKSESVQLGIEDIQNKNHFDLEFEIVDIEHLKNADLDQFPQLRDMFEYEVEHPFISMIIGANDHELHIPSEIHRGEKGLVLLETPLGLVFFGPSSSRNSTGKAIVNFINAKCTEYELDLVWKQ